jgi:acyl carrier protein
VWAKAPTVDVWSVPVSGESQGSEKLDRAEVFEIVRANLADILEIDASSISEGQSFSDDLEADSLALIELVEALEEGFAERSIGFRIEDEDLEDLKTGRDAVDYVYARVKDA